MTEYQIYDWHTCDEPVDNSNDDSDEDNDQPRITQQYVAYMFGVTPSGDNVSIKVTDYTPFFWLELPPNWKRYWTVPLLGEIQETLPKFMRDEMILDKGVKSVRMKYKFRDYQWNKPRPFLQLIFKSEAAMNRVYFKMKKPFNFPIAALRNHKFPVYEKNVTPVLRLIHLRKLKPSGWVKLGSSAKKVVGKLAETEYSQNWSVHWKDVHPGETDSIGCLKVASFDIEADSSHGDFPVAKKDYYKLAMNIYDEDVRCRKYKKKVMPALIKQWIKAAFRDYQPDEEYSIEMRSSIQTIILKDRTSLKLSSKDYDDLSMNCYRELMKSKTKPGKEVIESLKVILDESLPAVRGDKVIQIGTVLYRYGQEKTTMERHIVTLGGCDSLPGIEVVPCSNVGELFSEWVKFMKKAQPNIITGYNIFGFDFKFMWECAEEYGCLNLLKTLGPLKMRECNMIEKELSSAALGRNFLYYFDMPGIVTLDLLKVVQRDHNLSSYKLDSVSTDFIQGSITKIEHENDTEESAITIYTPTTFSLQVGQYIAIFKQSIIGNEFIGERRKIVSLVENTSICLESGDSSKEFPEKPKSFYWAVGKDDVSPQDIFNMQRGTDTDRAVVAKYCVQDCELCLNLIQKLEIVTNHIGMSNVCLVPFGWLFMRGQMIKTLSLVSSECLKEHYLIPELPRPKDDVRDSYEGAEVLEPTPAIFLEDPVSVLDYSSLYPSSMIGTNISHDTLITDPTYLGDDGAKKLEKLGIEFEDVSFDNYFQTLVGKAWKKQIDKTHPVVNCRYIQPPLDPTTGKIDDSKRGILPRILMKLLKARKDTRNKIKTEKDPFRCAVLDGLQLAYKVTANSLYGGVGAEVSSLYYKEIAASTTAVGRRHLHLAKDYVKEHFPRADIVYGDTDSIFVNFKPIDNEGNKLLGKEALQASIDMSVEVEKGIQKLLAYPHKLEYEKTFYPFILLRKKGYIGNKYEFDLDKYKQTSMGVVTKRRDNAPIVKYIYDGIIKKIINERDVEGSLKFLEDTIDKVLTGKFPMAYFVITKKLNAAYANPEQIVHKVLADRMGERDPGNKPQSNDRIPYAYVKTPTVPKLQGDRVEHPNYITEHNLKLDYLFYITNQISKPVCQVYGLALESLRSRGYKLSNSHFDKFASILKREGKDGPTIREKIMSAKQDEAYSVLFSKRVKIEEGRKYGQQQMTDFFKRR